MQYVYLHTYIQLPTKTLHQPAGWLTQLSVEDAVQRERDAVGEALGDHDAHLAERGVDGEPGQVHQLGLDERRLGHLAVLAVVVQPLHLEE